MKNLQRNVLLTPGPATTTDSVKLAQVVTDICPREKEFGNLMEWISTKLTEIAGGGKDYTTVLFNGSGTASMDVAINSVVPPGKKILIVNNGAYGERMLKIAKAYSIETVEVAFDWGIFPDVKKISKALAQDSNIDCVAMVHHETTTGMLNPVCEVGELCREKQKTFIVDAISSFAGIPVSMAEYNIHFMLSTSGKCIQAMPGCCFVTCEPDALKKIANYPPRSFYMNLYQQYQYFAKTKQMQFTPPVQTLYALKIAMEEFFSEGAEKRCQRYAKNWKCLIAGMKKLGFQKLLPDKQESKLLTTFLYPHDHFNFDQMHDLLYQKNFTIYPGKIGNKNTFRLANLGAIDVSDIENFLVALEECLHTMKEPIPYKKSAKK